MPQMNHTHRTGILQRWTIIQYELLPELKGEVGSLTPKLEKLIHILEWVRIEEFVGNTWPGVGRPHMIAARWQMPLWQKQCWAYQRQLPYWGQTQHTH